MENLEKAKEILEDIKCRNIYKLVGEIVSDKKRLGIDFTVKKV